MTIPLYEEQVYLWETTATVTACFPVEDRFGIILDRTIFFPEGGGQPGDTGKIDHTPVWDTYFVNDQIVHLCDTPFSPDQAVSLSLDSNRRFDHMQQHSGEHILSYAYWRLFNAVNVGFHLNERFGTIDLNQLLTPEQIQQGVDFANQIISENRPIHTYVADVKLLKQKDVRKISQKGGENPRVVEIEGADICTCCGTHVTRTGEVGCLMVTKAEKNRKGSRLTFLCGQRALRDYQKKTEILHGLTTLLSTEGEQLAPRIGEMKQALQEANAALKEKNRLIFEWQAEKLLRERGDSPYVLACLPDTTAAEAKALLNRLIQDQPVIALVVYQKNDSLSFFCAAHPKAKGQSCKTICDLLCGIFNAKGGGKEAFAQGGGKFTPDWQESANQILQQLIRMS